LTSARIRLKILPVLDFVKHEIFLEVRDLDVDFRQPYFHMDPDGDKCNEESEQAMAWDSGRPNKWVLDSLGGIWIMFHF